MIVFYASDLTWAVKIKSTADALGVPARPARSIDMLEARLADSPVGAFIADLAEPTVALALLERVSEENRRRSENAGVGGAGTGERPGVNPETPPETGTPGALAGPIRILAFGPHVEVDALQKARDLGAHEVMTRGAFSANLPDVLLRLHVR